MLELYRDICKTHRPAIQIISKSTRGLITGRLTYRQVVVDAELQELVGKEDDMDEAGKDALKTIAAKKTAFSDAQVAVESAIKAVLKGWEEKKDAVNDDAVKLNELLVTMAEEASKNSGGPERDDRLENEAQTVQTHEGLSCS